MRLPLRLIPITNLLVEKKLGRKLVQAPQVMVQLTNNKKLRVLNLLKKKMGEKLEEKRRHIEEKSRLTGNFCRAHEKTVGWKK
ncbi:hypothetical protein MTR_7g017660 [Medicago truncatula]|uniref:Uncharacterized protein n=1 Tax=Medicago truncatula TaxID=3880 RepID=G7KS20_MEDTR|nr:hypothetical protein MTR_7g017660 [Medicago truncatula]